MSGESWARFDDLRAGWGLRFPPTDTVLTTDDPAEVEAVLDAVDRATAAGRWAFGFVSYEAGAAWLGTAGARAADGVPLVWFGLTDAPVTVPPVHASSSGSAADGGWFGGWSAAEHHAGVRAIRERIAAGEVYQVNLTSRFSSTVSGDLEAYYADLALRQRGAHNAFVDTGRFAVLSASPESLVEVGGDVAIMRPMKGTAPRGLDVDEDAALAHALRASEKDRAENIMIVDLVRNDLARVAVTGSVEVTSLCEVERYETVHQLTSEVRARLRPAVGLVDLLRAVFPSGSVTGAPKRRAMQIIDAVEGSARGVYCGAVGWVGPPDAPTRLRFNVAIRTVVVDRSDGHATYGSGGGITWSSDPDAEYAELLTKTAVLRSRPTEFGLLETMRLDADGRLHQLDEHLCRLQRSAEYFGFEVDPSAVRRTLAEATSNRGPARVRLTVQRSGSAAVDVDPLPKAPVGPVRLVVDAEPVDPGDVFLRHKTTERLAYDIRRARHPEADDVLLVNTRGEITEAATANVAVLLAGRWCTPPLSSGCLPGVERAVRLARGELVEAVVTLADLGRADAIAVVNSLRGQRVATVDAGATSSLI